MAGSTASTSSSQHRRSRAADTGTHGGRGRFVLVISCCREVEIRLSLSPSRSVAAFLAATLLLLPLSPGVAAKHGDEVLEEVDVARLPTALVNSEEASRLTRWIALSGDNGSLPYIVIDKKAAAMLLFEGDGTLIGETPVLIGIGVGDDSAPGIGGKKLGEIGTADRTTPAGRFFAELGPAYGWKSVLWVDFADSVALHAVIKDNKKERRPQRLASPTPDDNRITFGCINIDTQFYLKQIKTRFKKGGVVYILPEVKSLDEVFPRVRLLPMLEKELVEQS